MALSDHRAAYRSEDALSHGNPTGFRQISTEIDRWLHRSVENIFYYPTAPLFRMHFFYPVKTNQKPNQDRVTNRWNTSVFPRGSNAGSGVARVSNLGLTITNSKPSAGWVTTETLTAIDPCWATDHLPTSIHAPFLLLAAPQWRTGLHQRLEYHLPTGSIR